MENIRIDPITLISDKKCKFDIAPIRKSLPLLFSPDFSSDLVVLLIQRPLGPPGSFLLFFLLRS